MARIPAENFESIMERGITETVILWSERKSSARSECEVEFDHHRGYYRDFTCALKSSKKAKR